jgi:hypothetical protein
MTQDVRLDVDGFVDDLDLITTVVELIVGLARDGTRVGEDLDSLEADALLGLARIRRRLGRLQHDTLCGPPRLTLLLGGDEPEPG